MTTKDNVYDFIVKFTTENLYPPTFLEICLGVGLASKASVSGYVHRLAEERKVILDNAGQPRSIKLVGYQLTKIGDAL